MIHLIETSIFAVGYQSPWHPKNSGIEAIGLRIFVFELPNDFDKTFSVLV